MRDEDGLDLGWRDVLATAVDHLLDSALEHEISAVQDTDVAGPEPAVEERFGVGLLVGQVAGGQPRTADRHLARLPGRDVAAGLIDNSNRRARGHADRSRPPL